MPCTRRPRLRAFAVLLGLAANLIAAGAPVLHVLMHELHEAGHHDEHETALAGHEGASGTDHPDAEVHPRALHDDANLVKRDVLRFAVAVPAAVSAEALQAPAEYVDSAPPGALRSRAPPPGDPARAPPLV